MPDQHAANGLTASGAHRWLVCTPSAKLEQQFPNKTSRYAEEGTVAHAAAELTARYFLGQCSEMDFENELDQLMKSEYFDGEMREAAGDYARLILSRRDEALKSCEDPQVFLETRLDFGTFVPGGFGTGDCVILSEPVLEVIDFKYGKGTPVYADQNPQMRLYALGAWLAYGDLYDFTTVRMTIFQPRIREQPSVYEESVDDLLAWAGKVVKPAADLAAEGLGEFVPGEETCRFCRAKQKCRARAEQNLELFDENPEPLLLSLKEAGEILKKANDIEAWLKDLKALVTGTLISGGEVPGWKLVEGRSTRKLAGEDEVVKAMTEAGYDASLLYEKKLLTLTQLEKDFGKKEIARVLGGLITKPPGAPQLAPESDKRPAFAPADAVIAAFDEGEDDEE